MVGIRILGEGAVVVVLSNKNVVPICAFKESTVGMGVHQLYKFY